jgi:hypothetical protein
MAYIVRSKITGRYLIRGVDEWEVYWSKNPADATQFKTAFEVTEYLSGWQIDKVDLLDPSEIASTKAQLTLGDLPEGKKFKYAIDVVGAITFMKVLQPFFPKFDSKNETYIEDTDGRYYLNPSSDACWVIILDNAGDTHPQCQVGRIILLNNDVSVQEVQ